MTNDRSSYNKNYQVCTIFYQMLQLHAHQCILNTETEIQFGFDHKGDNDFYSHVLRRPVINHMDEMCLRACF